MRNIFIFISFMAMLPVKSQKFWQHASSPSEKSGKPNKIHGYFTLDQAALQQALIGAKAASRNALPVTIELPLLNGKTEKFAVYSRPVVEKSLEDQYGLHAYVAVGIDDPGKYARLSFANGQFNAMIINGNEYTFIDPQDKGHTLYSVAEKTNKTDNGKAFLCSTKESVLSKEQINKLYDENKNIFSKNAGVTARSSDQKFRTLRLALSVTGEYSQYFGGTVAGALTAMNATMTRVNGVMERDLGLHLTIINKPEIIYLDPATDPYSPAAAGAAGAWNAELQKTLTSVVGETNYDIGHLFGASGGGGNAGCVGCVCISPTTAIPLGKGSAYTSPADGIPQGDNFDIDYVAHEMGHQVGANHTFSYVLETGTGANQEPGSASTIMGYAGITGTDNDVQAHSDPYYHYYSIQQIQAVLEKATCGVETSVKNTPPAIAALPAYTIPKSTAFVLTAQATDADGDGLNYTWEQADNASVTINKLNLGTTATGADFRSIAGTSNPARYFPALSTVMNGSVSDPESWESASSVARVTDFSVTVRDNNPAGPQNTTANEVITVGNDGPFKLTGSKVYFDRPFSTVTWDTANTAAAPYNVQNVKIDYTQDNGSTWTTLAAATPNDGTENFSFASLAKGTLIKIRITAIGNVFYAVAPYTVTNYPAAVSNCATQITPANNATSVDYRTGTTLNWSPAASGENADSFDIYLDTSPNPTKLAGNTTANSFTVTGLLPSATYYWKVVPKNLLGNSSECSVFSFTTMDKAYCDASATDNGDEKISTLTFADINQNTVSTEGYENFTSTVGNVVAGSTYTFSASSTGASYTTDQVLVWIDFNQNKDFSDAGELVLTVPQKESPWTGTITIPANAPAGKTVMRVRLAEAAKNSNITPCGASLYGQVQDYTLNITAPPDNPDPKITFFPNPVSDVLHITHVPDKTSYSIFTMAGRLVESGTVTDDKIGVSNLINGVYMITLHNNGKIITSKFIKN